MTLEASAGDRLKRLAAFLAHAAMSSLPKKIQQPAVADNPPEPLSNQAEGWGVARICARYRGKPGLLIIPPLAYLSGPCNGATAGAVCCPSDQTL